MIDVDILPLLPESFFRERPRKRPGSAYSGGRAFSGLRPSLPAASGWRRPISPLRRRRWII
jgi:hypothetical protein